MTISLPIVLVPHQAETANLIASLPSAAGIYALTIARSSTHLAWSANLPKRLRRLLLASSVHETDSVHKLRERVTAVECWPTGSKLEASLLMYAIARRSFPGDYARRLRLRLPWFLGLAKNDRFARLVVTNRVPRDSDLLLGPFASRDAAQYYEQELSSLFQIRRCTEKLVPSPEHPGCIYGEMNQCLRPCQCAVSDEEYAGEAARVEEFMLSNGTTAFATLTAARDRASGAMDFEQAAQLHKQIERVNAAIAARGEIVDDVRQFSGVALTRSTQAMQFYLWPMYQGYWQDPVLLNVSTKQAEAKSLDNEVRQVLTQAMTGATCEGDRPEHLAVFLRWYRSSWRDGEWFPFLTLADLNYRKLVREVSKLVKTDSAVGAA